MAGQYVDSDRMPFAYTIGLARYGLPELLVAGVSPRRIVRMLNSVGRRAVVATNRQGTESLYQQRLRGCWGRRDFSENAKFPACGL
jgi:hypothetical protein